MIRFLVLKADVISELHMQVNDWITWYSVPEENIINITLIAPGVWMMVYRKDSPPSGTQPPESLDMPIGSSL